MKLRMPIPRLSEDEMREIVLDRLACKVMFSQEEQKTNAHDQNVVALGNMEAAQTGANHEVAKAHEGTHVQ